MLTSGIAGVAGGAGGGSDGCTEGWLGGAALAICASVCPEPAGEGALPPAAASGLAAVETCGLTVVAAVFESGGTSGELGPEALGAPVAAASVRMRTVEPNR